MPEVAPIRLRYFLRVRNVGDRINPQLIEALFGRRTIFVSGGDKPHLMAVGSILATATTQSHIWGTGLIHPSKGAGGARAGSIHAVRGKLTHAALRTSGLALPDLPLGDPAFLIKRCGLAPGAGPKRYRLGLVPHYVDRADPRVLALLREDGVVDLNVHDDPAEFLAEMAACEAVASSSLHGLVFAEALAIPNLWIELSEKVAGGGFKFRDWFSTMLQPQNAAFRPDDRVRPADLIERATLHEPQIDEEALLQAFPSIPEIIAADEPVRPFVSLKRCRRQPPPIFVISYNRAAFLLRAIDSYRKLAADACIVIHDNGSDDPLTLQVLERLEDSTSIKIYRRNKISNADHLNNISETVAHFFEYWAEPSRYVVTDCDIDMSTTRADAIELYDELLELCRDVDCVGPMLTIRDVSPSYPLYNEMMNRHIEQFWRHEPEWIDTSRGRIAALRVPADTTFQLHRAGDRFARNQRGLRVYFPYEAQHLDWYRWWEVGAYATSSAVEISKWSNAAFTERHRDAPLLHERFSYIDADASGELVRKLERLPATSRFTP